MLPALAQFPGQQPRNVVDHWTQIPTKGLVQAEVPLEYQTTQLLTVEAGKDVSNRLLGGGPFA
jgi:hypothetical protein